MDNHRNLIIAVVLSAILLFGWDFAMRTYYPEPDVPAEVASSETAAAPSAAGSAVPGDDGATARPVEIETALASAERVRIDAPEISGSINPVGARVDDIDLKTHRQTVERDSGPIRLFSPAGTEGQHFAQFGWVGEGVALPDADTPWQLVEGEVLTQETPVTLGWDNGAGLQFRLRFAIDEHYMLTVTQTVSNTGEGTVALRPYAFVNRTSVNADRKLLQRPFRPDQLRASEARSNFDWDYEDVAGRAARVVHGAVGTDWIGFTDIYWMSRADCRRTIRRLRARSARRAATIIAPSCCTIQ